MKANIRRIFVGVGTIVLVLTIFMSIPRTRLWILHSLGLVKEARVLTEKGWEKRYLWRSQLPSDWDDDFSTLLTLFVPESIVKEEYDRVAKSDRPLEDELGLDRFAIHDHSYYVLRIKFSELSTRDWFGAVPVIFEVADSYPKGHALAVQSLDESESTHVKKHKVLYVTRGSIRKAIDDRIDELRQKRESFR